MLAAGGGPGFLLEAQPFLACEARVGWETPRSSLPASHPLLLAGTHSRMV